MKTYKLPTVVDKQNKKKRRVIPDDDEKETVGTSNNASSNIASKNQPELVTGLVRDDDSFLEDLSGIHTIGKLLYKNCYE
jgi:hypothetical protein